MHVGLYINSKCDISSTSASLTVSTPQQFLSEMKL